MSICRHHFIYRSSTIGGYEILCEHCGQMHGSSKSADPQFLAALNCITLLHEGRRARRAHEPIKEAPPEGVAFVEAMPSRQLSGRLALAFAASTRSMCCE
jgi:hypothetical protein